VGEGVGVGSGVGDGVCVGLAVGAGVRGGAFVTPELGAEPAVATGPPAAFSQAASPEKAAANKSIVATARQDGHRFPPITC